MDINASLGQSNNLSGRRLNLQQEKVFVNFEVIKKPKRNYDRQ